MHIVFFYAAVLALLFVALSVRTILLRRRFRIAVGDADNEEMLRAIRAHSNFAEYVPLTLLLIYFVELGDAEDWLVHGLCIALLAGRILHAIGISRVRENYRIRTAAMALTFTTIVAASLSLLSGALRGGL